MRGELLFFQDTAVETKIEGALEGQLPGHQLIDDDSKGIEVASSTYILVLEFRSDVRGVLFRAKRRANRKVLVAMFQEPGMSEVCQSSCAGGQNIDVLWTDITMEYILAVCFA